MSAAGLAVLMLLVSLSEAHLSSFLSSRLPAVALMTLVLALM